MTELLYLVSKEDGGPWCHKCPLWESTWSECQAMESEPDGHNRSTHHDGDGSPPWCPLRSGGVTVRTNEAT